MKITTSPYNRHRARASMSSSHSVPAGEAGGSAPSFPPRRHDDDDDDDGDGDIDDHHGRFSRLDDDNDGGHRLPRESPSSLLDRRLFDPAPTAPWSREEEVGRARSATTTTTTTTTTSRRSFLSPIAIAAATFAIPPSSLPSSGRGGGVVRTTIVAPPPPPSSSPPFAASAAETVGKDGDCDDASCLGVWDGLLADCPHRGNGPPLPGWGGGGAGCVSSQDDAPGIFAEPWDYSDDMPLIPSSSSSSSSSDSSSSSADKKRREEDAYVDRMDRLILALDSTSRERDDEVTVLLRDGRYLRALVVDGTTGERSVCEFYFTPNDTTVQFRLGTTTTKTTAAAAAAATAVLGRRSLSNGDRSERIRRALRYAKVPVLRNRRRAMFFVESDSLDGFGPGSGALGPPEEMSPGEMVLDGAIRLGGGGMGRTRRGSDDVDPRMRIDWVESFPFDGRKGL
jgi:hypothetical protein